MRFVLYENYDQHLLVLLQFFCVCNSQCWYEKMLQEGTTVYVENITLKTKLQLTS